MEKLNNIEYEKRIIELEKVFYNKLNLKNVLNESELVNFFQNVLKYLKHGRGKELLLVGRTPETLENKIDYFINFATKVGLNNKDIICCIERFPNILNIMDDKFVLKYIFLSVLENEKNTLRRDKLITDTEDFEVSLEVMFSRYCLMKELNYNSISWSNLVHESHSEFIKKFVKGAYSKPYKIYNSPLEMTSEMLREKYPIDYEFIKGLINNNGGLNVNIRSK